VTLHSKALATCATAGRLLAIAALLGLPSRSDAADAQSTVTLRDALIASLKQSPALRVQAEAVEQKYGLLEQASGAFDWVGTGAAGVTRERTPVFGPLGTSLVDASVQSSYSLGLEKEFRNGISIDPNASVGVTDTQFPAAPTFGLAQVSFVVNVPLLRGLGVDSTGAAEAAARGDVQVARLLYEYALSSQALNLASSYWASRAADLTLEVQRDVERSAERLVASTKVLVESRVFGPAFLLQAEANLRDKRSVRIAAELAARNARFALGQTLGLPATKIGSTPAAVDDFPRLGPSIAPADEMEQIRLIERALGARADMLASRESIVPLNILARAAELNLKPQANLSLSAGYDGLNSGPNPLAPLGRRVTGANGQVGVSFAWPFQNTFQLGVLRQSRGSVRAAEAQAEDLSRQVASDVLNALEEVRLRADGVRSAQETVDLGNRAVAAQNELLKAGEGTIIDVITLQNLLADARTNYISADAGYATAIAQLHYALGSIFTSPNPTSESFSLNDLTALPPP
jgi:outer membrane protein TolC